MDREIARPFSMSTNDLNTLKSDVNKFLDEFLQTEFDRIDKRTTGKADGFVSNDETRAAMKDASQTQLQRDNARAVFRNTELLADLHWDWYGNSQKVSKADLQTLKASMDQFTAEMNKRQNQMDALKRHWQEIVSPEGQKLADPRLTKNNFNAFMKNLPENVSDEDRALLKEIQKNFDWIAGWDSWHQPNAPFSTIAGDDYIDEVSVRDYLHWPKEQHRKALEAAASLWDDLPKKSALEQHKKK